MTALLAITNGGDVVAAAVVVAISVGAMLVGLVMVGSMRGAYDQIGGRMFDRPGEGRGPNDAEYEEFGAVLASMCEEEERSTPRS